MDGIPTDDSVSTDTISTDSVPADSMSVLPPAAADGLFDDFAYNFMHNRRFQLSRIEFPLKNVVDGQEHPITREQWHFDPLYANRDVYTMLFEDEAAVKKEQDAAISDVTVEWVYLSQKRVKQYLFSKKNGKWMLHAMVTHELEKNVNSDFYAFYNRFAEEEKFQLQHVSNPLRFRTYDSDAFQEIDGVLDAAQWPDFRPDMPRHVITNINYGQQYAGNQRVLVITSPSAGMSCSLTFRRRGETWMLVAMESI